MTVDAGLVAGQLMHDPSGQQAGLALVRNDFVIPEVDFVVVVVLTMCYSMPYFFLTTIYLSSFYAYEFG